LRILVRNNSSLLFDTLIQFSQQYSGLFLGNLDEILVDEDELIASLTSNEAALSRTASLEKFQHHSSSSHRLPDSFQNYCHESGGGGNTDGDSSCHRLSCSSVLCTDAKTEKSAAAKQGEHSVDCKNDDEESEEEYSSDTGIEELYDVWERDTCTVGVIPGSNKKATMEVSKTSDLGIKLMARQRHVFDVINFECKVTIN